MQKNKFASLKCEKNEIITKKFLRVLNYNILAPSLLSISTRGNVKKDNKKYLSWNFRQNAILKQVEQYSPDIICFEEFENDLRFNQSLSNMSFDVI